MNKWIGWNGKGEEVWLNENCRGRDGDRKERNVAKERERNRLINSFHYPVASHRLGSLIYFSSFFFCPASFFTVTYSFFLTWLFFFFPYFFFFLHSYLPSLLPSSLPSFLLSFLQCFIPSFLSSSSFSAGMI